VARIRVFPLCQWCGERNDRPWLRICGRCAQGTISRLGRQTQCPVNPRNSQLPEGSAQKTSVSTRARELLPLLFLLASYKLASYLLASCLGGFS